MVYKPKYPVHHSQFVVDKPHKSTNMKFIVAFVALFAVALAAPQHGADKDAVVVRSELDNIGVDGFKYAYETSNGIAAEAQGHIINAGLETEAVAQTGSFRYLGPDGVTYEVKYIADENGFQPQGAHLPVAPQ